MEEKEKFIVDILHKELEQIRAKSYATDERLFKLLTIGVIPFLVLIGYAMTDPKFRILLIALPYLTGLGILVTFFLVNHYYYSSFYMKYLEAKINTLMKNNELIDSQFGKAFYTGWHSLVNLGFIFSFVLLIAINIFLIPIINTIKRQFLLDHCKLPEMAQFFLNNFWVPTVTFIFIILVICGFSYWQSTKKAKEILKINL